MGIPVLEESCFGCCSIKTGARIISWLTVIFSAIAFLLLLLGEVALITTGNTDLCKGDVNCTANLDHQMAQNNAKVIIGVVIIVIGILIVLEGLLFIVGIANLYGVYKEKPSYMVPYLIVSVISMIFQVVFIVASVANNGITSNAISSIIGLAFSIYFFLIVHSYFKVLKSGRNNGMVV